MHELLVAIDNSTIEKNIYVGVDPKLSKSPEDYVIKINYNLDADLLKTIELILEKRNLKIEKMEEFFSIR
jgi:hypothetical protein